MAGLSKNNPDNKKMSQRNVLVTSDKCIACREQCEKGKKYIETVKKRFGHGCVCEKLKEVKS
jgi:hypothetical protein